MSDFIYKSTAKIGKEPTEYFYRKLPRFVLKKVVELEDEWEKTALVIREGTKGLPEPDSIPFGIAIKIAKKIIGESTPDVLELLIAAREKVQEPVKIQEMLIATAWPEFTFEKQDQMTIEEWVEAWAMSEWELVAIKGIDPSMIERLLSGPQENRKQQTAEDFDRIYRGADGRSVESQEFALQHQEHLAKVVERLKRQKEEQQP